MLSEREKKIIHRTIVYTISKLRIKDKEPGKLIGEIERDYLEVAERFLKEDEILRKMINSLLDK